MPRTDAPNDKTPAKPRARARSARQQPDAATDRQSNAGNGGSSATAASKTVYNPSYDEIAEEAYHRFLRRGAQHGQDFDDWLEAERELKARNAP